MRKRIIKNHILFGVFIIPVFLIFAISSVSAGVNLYLKTGVDEGNLVMACSRGADIDIRTEVSLGRAVSISEASYYRVSPDTIFSAWRSENTLSLISASKGTYLNGVFKKLKRMLSGISKLF
jgi:hypothetical protein